MSKLIYPTVSRAENALDVRSARHGKFYHLHMDVRAPIPVAHDRLATLISESSGALKWTDFHKPSIDEVRKLFSQSKLNDLKIEKLCDRSRNGAPLSHLSGRKLFAAVSSPEINELWKLFDKGVEAMLSTSLGGYVELEEIAARNVISSRPTAEYCGSRIPVLPFGPFRLVLLTSPEVNREFRTTEIHLTFEQLKLVDLNVLELLLDIGFYTAFIRNTDGSLKLILTIQGFDPDIAMLYGLLHGWVSQCVNAGVVTSNVTLKKEDIAGYAILGDWEHSGVQRVIKPLSLIEAWSDKFWPASH